LSVRDLMIVSSRFFEFFFLTISFCILSSQEMEKAQAKGDVDEEELRALEMDVTGKVSSKNVTTVPKPKR